jgi:hypothetical protein
MLRLNKDQECYDFLKWWSTTGADPQYDWGNMSLPYLDIKDANPLEPVDFFVKEINDLPHMAAVTLLKIRLLFILDEKYPSHKELRRDSRMAKNPNVANPQDLGAEIEKVKGQIRELYKAVAKLNQHLWPALVDPGDNLDAQPPMYSIGSKEQMQATLKWTWEAWTETSGAIEFIASYGATGQI